MHPRRRGFTLIEVMVVLSILALIAVLAYNFFGSTMQQAKLSAAATKVQRDWRNLSEAWQRYTTDTGSEPANYAALVSAGYIKAVPESDTTYFTSAVYVSIADYWNVVGGAALDSIFVAAYATAELCAEINRRTTDLGGLATPSASGRYGYALQCWTSSGNGKHYVWGELLADP